jgi:outer membrane receptor for ferrienterochelin and colicins
VGQRPRRRALALLLCALSASPSLANTSHAAPAQPPPTDGPPKATKRPRARPASQDSPHRADRRTIVVTASRTEERLGDAAVVVEVVTRAEIEASGAENLAEILEEQPGVQIAPGARGGAGGLGIRMLGLDPQHTLILVDGLRATGRLNGVIDLTRFTSEGIRQVEVIKGPASVLYGSDAMAGVVNLITRDAEAPFAAEAHATYGSFNTVDTSGLLALRRGRWRSRLSGGFHRSDGFDLDPSTATTNAPAGYTAGVAQRTVYEPHREFRLISTAEYQQRDLRGVIEEGGGATFDRRNFTRIFSASLSPERLWDAPARLRVRGHYTRFSDLALLDQRGDDELDRLEHTLDQLFQAIAQYDHQIGRHELSVGAEGTVELLHTPRLPDGARSRERLALYLQDEWQLTRGGPVAARLIAGVRLDADSLFGVYPMPRLALRVDPHPRWTMRASYGRGFRAPSFRELFLEFPNPSVGYTIRGDPNLAPESSWGGLGGVEWRPRPWLDLGVNAFHNRLRDLIIIDTSDALGNWKYTNIGAARTQGLELSANARGGPLHLGASYTLTDTRDLLLGEPLPGRSLHQASLLLSLRAPKIDTHLNLRAKLFGRQLYYGEADERAVTAPFATLDLRLSQPIRRVLDAFIGVDNLLNAGDPRYIPLTPRSFYAGLNARY